MRTLSLPFLSRLGDLAPTALRVGVGLVFVANGYAKLTGGAGGVAGMLTGLGVGAPTLVAWLMIVAELVGGAMLLVGLLTRLVTLPLIGIMVGSLILVKGGLGIAEAGLDIALLAGLVALLLVGPGRLSLDRVLGIEPRPVEPVDVAARSGAAPATATAR